MLDPCYWDENSGIGCHSPRLPVDGVGELGWVDPAGSFDVTGTYSGGGTEPEPGGLAACSVNIPYEVARPPLRYMATCATKIAAAIVLILCFDKSVGWKLRDYITTQVESLGSSGMPDVKAIGCAQLYPLGHADATGVAPELRNAGSLSKRCQRSRADVQCPALRGPGF